MSTVGQVGCNLSSSNESIVAIRTAGVSKQGDQHATLHGREERAAICFR
jgi:hypothetical protein